MNLPRKRILVIEDSEFICAVLKNELAAHGFEVSAVHDGRKGLLRARRRGFDLIILDLILPELPGEEVCRQLKKDARTEKIPILMLTGKGTDADRVLGRVIGADAYIPKPFDPAHLVKTVSALVEKAY